MIPSEPCVTDAAIDAHLADADTDATDVADANMLADAQGGDASPGNDDAGEGDAGEDASDACPGGRTIELCNAIDDDCDGLVDESITSTVYADTDHDGHGASDGAPQQACAVTLGFALVADDCNDSDAAVHPGAIETCDALDNDCDSNVDEGVSVTAYVDNDNDEYGAPSAGTVQVCHVGVNLALAAGDCNDNDATIHPGAIEICDALDNNCSNGIDEGVDCN